MQVNLRVGIHQEGEVELVRMEQALERGDESLKFEAQPCPLIGIDVDDAFARPLQDEHRLAEKILISIDRKCPARPFFNDRFGAQAQLHHTMISRRLPQSRAAPAQVVGNTFRFWSRGIRACQNGDMRRGITGAFYAVLAITFLYAGGELLMHFNKTLLCDITIVAFALGTLRAVRLAFDAFTGSPEPRVKSI